MRSLGATSIFLLGVAEAGCGTSVGGTTTSGGMDSVPADGGADAGPATLAPAGDAAKAGPVDGIRCDTSEQVVFHVHSHLDIFVDGAQELLAAGIGIGPPLQIENGFVVDGSCFSWLHTHDQTGVIHIESPLQRAYTLGNFFDIWGLPLSATEVGPAQGKVSAFLDGKPFTGDVRALPLGAHHVVQLDVGEPVVAPQPYTFPPGL